MSLGFYFLISLLLTSIIEVSILFITIKYLFKEKIKKNEILYWGLFVNLFTLPYLWFIFPLFISHQRYIFFGESLVVLIESAILRKTLKINLIKTIFLSLIANISSYLVGQVILK